MTAVVAPAASPSPRIARRRWPMRLGAAALVLAALAVDASPVVGVAALFVLVAPFEKLFPRHDQPLRRPGLGTDIAYGVAQPLLGPAGLIAGAIVGILSLAWLPGLMIRPLVAAIPAAPRAVVGILLFDVAVYWAHRWSHEVPFLWRFHAIHHSSERMDWVSGIRNHPFDGALLAPPFLFLLGAGFTPQFSGVLTIIQVVTGLFLHANVRWRWRPLHRVVITPEFHHWHHANEPGAVNSNYSVFLPLWDIIFGTYFVPRDRRPSVYGVAEHVPDGIAAQLRHPLRGLPAPSRIARHPVASARALRAGLRRGVGQVWRSTVRPRRRDVWSF